MSSPWEIVIGLETHVQLSTASKMFSDAPTAFGAAPNTQASAVDLALPGALPVANRAAVERAIRLGLAVGATIAPVSVFARKNYFYPDLPKGYQISQFEIPVVQGGHVPFLFNGAVRQVELTRAHLEEDAGKSVHGISFEGQDATGIDLNRAGTPLLEVVSEPVMRSAAEAAAYARALHALVVWLDICDGNLQEGSFRCDANVSVRRPGEPLGTRCEIKNLNSFRFLEKAITFEAQRQIELIEDGGRVRQETRLFDPDRGETRTMRTKEDSHDYRYFPDPDLPPLTIAPAWIEEVRATLPELPAQMAARFVRDYALPEIDAAYLTQSRAHAAYFEACAQACGAPKLAANWIMGELAAQLNRAELELDASPVSARQLGLLITRVQDGTLSGKTAREVFAALWSADEETRGDVDAIIETRGLRQISDGGAIAEAVAAVLAANPKNVEEYRAGKAKALNALVGQVMKATGGRANPQQVSDALRAALAAA
ncbi:MAG: Asp-tRNA(Asn)/Glu-tRNA(Gln) amidotransferase subunit GatB [Betaproteobacteria bacterium]|jgi:aspartyl-tRNA(Asn)/glutamyl-tRNA(Gln) amidotransferase subunit B|nr:Asp-tRNA(Asn)/Glu-tRNA(Gln) amidotransferase subunit GatB [Thiomonas sp.]MDE2130301.1 Asp-tRNA(Asn)/Glu-tRNA(Gln) amidotransferase subunit GatB [Betaproteobacteria bacterium]OZB63969.1 MAG: glutaminyl-tRNA synthase (glutamine-hydrolyzing) subunit B [Thiomonas sp. 13-66-29]